MLLHKLYQMPVAMNIIINSITFCHIVAHIKVQPYAVVATPNILIAVCISAATQHHNLLFTGCL